MKYKLLVLDLDGTLTNSSKEVTPRSQEVLIAAQEAGVRIVLASGRPTFGVAPIADQLRLQDYGGYILSYNGGEILNWQTREVMYRNILDPEVIPTLYHSARREGFAILSYDSQYIVTESPNDQYVKKEAFLNKMEIKHVRNFLMAMDHPVTKCLIVGDPDRLVWLEEELYERLSFRISVFRSEPYFLELVPLGIDKGRSMATLLGWIGLDREEIIAIGDGYNDLPLITYAGMGIAMANAQPPVKAQAKFVTLSNDDDGVAYAVKKFILD